MPSHPNTLTHTSMPPKRLASYKPFEPDVSFFRNMRAERARSYHFLLDGDEELLARLCDRWFNAPGKGSVSFRPAAPVVLTVINTSCAVGHCEQETWEQGDCPLLPDQCSRVLLFDDYDRVQGAVKCNECLVSVFVMKDGDPAVYAFTPYRFIDSNILMIRNRELLGLPDVHVSMKFPLIPVGEQAEEHLVLSVRMKLKRAFGNEEAALDAKWSRLPGAGVKPMMEEILLIDPGEQGNSPASVVVPWEGLSGVMSGMYDFVREYAAAPGREKLLHSPLFRHPESFALMNRWVNLKQFRSAEPDKKQSDGLSYQAIVEYEFGQMNIRSGGRINREFVVRFPRIGKAFVDSIAFVENLGVKEENPVKAAYWMDFDYELLFRNLLWEAKPG